MKNLLSLLVIVLFAGCYSLQSVLHERSIAKYESRNQDVSEDVITAIREGRILKGMTMAQAELAWGIPGNRKKIPSGPAKKEEIWYYYDAAGRASGMKADSLFAVDVPSKRIIFDGAGKLYEWKIYDEEIETARVTAMTKTLPKSVLKGDDGSGVLRAGSYQDWPYIILSSVVGQGEDAAAVLNGTLVRQGQSFRGVKLLAVGTHGIKLEYNKQVGILKKGESTQ